MAAKTSAEETSERKRISIPKADESVLAWWNAQHDVGLSVRMLIRAEIERNGYVDSVYRPVAQLPRRGRPPGSGIEVETVEDTETAPAPVATLAHAPVAHTAPTLTPVPQPVGSGGFDPIDAIMNG